VALLDCYTPFMMIPLESLGTFVLASAVLALVPGPDNLFVLMQSAMHGRKAGLLITLGLCSGLIVHTSAVALGVAVIFQTSVVVFSLLKMAGALYLAYLAWQAFQASATTLDGSDTNPYTNAALYRRGILMNITNPKVTIFFLAFLPQFASPEYGAISPQIFLLGGVFMSTALLVFSAIAILAGTLGVWLQRSPTTQMYLNRGAGMVFIGLALKLATTSQTL